MKRYRCLIWAVTAVMLLLAGCQGKDYEKIPGIEERENGEKSSLAAKEPEAIALEKDTGSQPGEIVIEGENVSAALEEALPAGAGNGAAGIVSGEEGNRERDNLTLLFSGDVLLSDHVLRAYEKAGGIQGVLDGEYQRVIREADFFLVNEEFPFSSRGKQAEDKQYTFRLPPERISLFQEMGIDGVTLANNHALDFGQDALLDTCGILDRAGILHTGGGEDLEAARRPILAGLKGKKIAVIGATRVIPVADWAAGRQHPGMLAAYDMALLLEEIRRQKQENDFVAVFIHWGIEREEKPQEYQRDMGRQMIDAGADLVVGSHPHVLQGIEYYQEKPIVYSLGNFVFGSSIPRTALLQVTWENPQEENQAGESPEGKKGPVLRLIPGTSKAGYTQVLTGEDTRQEFFRYMESISQGIRFLEDGTVVPPEG